MGTGSKRSCGHTSFHMWRVMSWQLLRSNPRSDRWAVVRAWTSRHPLRQCCVLTLLFSSSGHSTKHFSFSFFWSTAGHMAAFLQGAKGFIESPSPRVPACPLLLKILGSLHCSVPGERGLLCLWPFCQSKTIQTHGRGGESRQMWNAV